MAEAGSKRAGATFDDKRHGRCDIDVQDWYGGQVMIRITGGADAYRQLVLTEWEASNLRMVLDEWERDAAA